jgi:micrococcal nuclease
MLRPLLLAVAAAMSASFAFGSDLPGLERAISSITGVLAHATGAKASNTSSGANSTSDTAAVVERVLDGDTVVLRGWKERVRLASIDAPEMSHGYRQPGQPFSVQSTNWLTRKVQGKAVTVRCVDEDRYGRQVCNLYLQGEFVNRELVRAGFAWANTANARFLRDKSVLDAQKEAQAQHRGLWASAQPTPPWKWREECWRGAVCRSPELQ